MESLKLSFECVVPIFLLMALGYALRALKVAKKETFDAMNKLVFKAFLPVLLFKNIYETDIGEVFDLKYICFIVIGVICVFIAGYFAVLLITKENSRRGTMLQGFFRSNFAILGLPLIKSVCGEKSGGLASLTVAIVVPLFNVLAVIALERFRNGNIKIKPMLKGIITNPLIIGCGIGVIFWATGIKLPFVLEDAISDVSSIASPLAMIILGASFTFSSLKGYVKDVTITVAVRLVIVPLIMLFIAALLNFRGEAIACLLVAFGSPVAVSSFAMAQQMGGDEKLAAQVVVISSAGCIITFFGWIFVLSSMQLF